MTEWMSKWGSEWMTDWVSVDEWIREWVNEWVRVGEYMNEWVYEWMSEWMSKRVGEWKNRWMFEWMSEYGQDGVGEWMKLDFSGRDPFVHAAAMVDSPQSGHHIKQWPERGWQMGIPGVWRTPRPLYSFSWPCSKFQEWQQQKCVSFPGEELPVCWFPRFCTHCTPLGWVSLSLFELILTTELSHSSPI